jgi:phage major head subunit gpT-like protein
MIINRQTLDLVLKGFKTVFNTSYMEAPSEFEKIAMTVPSTSRDETYAWMGNLPSMREWIGPRVVNNLSAYGFTLKNRKFESTVSVARDDFEDDRLGTFKPAFAEMGSMARRHPDELVFSLLKTGFTSLCYDGQAFFDTDHPVIGEDGETVTTVANTDGGSGAPWFLLDVSRAVRPIIRAKSG